MSKKNLINNIIFICLLQISGTAVANNAAETDTEALYSSGLSHYEKKHYEKAISDLKLAVEKKPDVAKYHHILAVSYGREAEQVNWFKAMDYAKKTLLHLEKANELDPLNLEILDDLMDYYHEAPSFLGGDTKKGDEIQALIEKLTLENEKMTKK
ncbi:MAG: hypothetical protein ACPHLK_10305 [Gammaproteobacteria bacterium]|jgi:tetratricopeptide (TPR) repeat protein